MKHMPRGLETKPVFDWNHEPLGTVLGSELDPRTQDPMSLIIGLNQDARDRLGTEQETLSLPFDTVFSIRRDEVRLSRGLGDLTARPVEAPEIEQEPSRVLEVTR